ncbi:ATP-grasp domain-containing protein [Pseudoxanthomonas daejeonensis]|uniref:Carbamoylphosphate synthase large subunit short form n=1 Tax=Pseudoxanthomonas daejeonensis TaxID=266062 RepID=A0ABQ6Z6B3_9GAMM|nr:ATP-grasp domain-containing protein [Pseudoxanthomonas daejeonensis]KAF1694061.1 carbamoylphosphate synthase large subunit short form [Pseudoxanthomonas daejeonensis]
MSGPINVLVFPCGSEIGLEVNAALRYAKDVRLHGASSVDDHGEFAYRRYRRIDADTVDGDLVGALNALIREWDIDLVVPAHDSVIPLLACARERLLAPAAVPDADTAALCRDKRLAHARLRPLGIVPDDAGAPGGAYPVFAKPAIGQGSQGAERVDDVLRHRQLLEGTTPYVISEYLPGDEYTVDCVSDGDGVLLHAAPRRRSRVRNGISVRTEPATGDPALAAMATAIAGELRLRGAWFFQARRDADGVPKLLEVAPRIAGSMALSRVRGVNHALLHVYAHLGRPFAVLPQSHPVQLDRALGNRYRATLDYRRVYLDLDDTLIVDGAVNPVLAGLLYQWAAAGIEMVLLTRHAGCPHQALARHRVCADLFSRIVHLRDGSPKSAAIETGVPAIFIDDSFRERQDVHRVAGIPVFDPDAIEQLLDLRA